MSAPGPHRPGLGGADDDLAPPEPAEQAPQDPDRFTVKSEWSMVRVERRGWWRR